MYWVIQNNIYSEEGFDSLITALTTLDLPYSIHKCIPFIGTLDPEPMPTQDRVIVMGSYTLAREAQRRGWNPGVFLNENFNYEVQLKHWGNHMINSDAVICPFALVPEQINPFFIRPLEDSKAFTGVVTDWPDFVEWRNRVLALTPEDGATITPETMVMVCGKKEIYAEYRTWIVDGRAVAWSQYKTGARKHYIADVDPRIIEFAEAYRGGWSPHRAYVLDIFETPNGLFIGEVNNLNSAGFYKANMGKLLMALEEAFGN
jgi:hypothetical protein